MTKEALLSICAILLLLIATAGVTIAILNRRNLKRVVRVLGVSAFLMLMAGLFPRYTEQNYAFALTLFESMCAMLMNSNPKEVLASFNDFQLPFIGAYKVVLLALLILSPLFTIGITLSLFSEKFTRILYRIRCVFSDTYLFSAINERSLSVAEDIAASNPKAVILFAPNTPKENIDANHLARIKSIEGYLLNDDVVHINHTLRHTRNYYLLDADRNKNLDAGLRLYNKYHTEQANKINVWIYRKDQISEVIFDHLSTPFNVHLINEESLIARGLASDYPPYNAIRDNKLSVLIIGAGHIGLEILKTMIMSTCLGDKVKTEINVIDREGEKSKARFEMTAPGLIEKRNVKFHNGDVTSSAFSAILDTIHPTYIVLCLGNETLNMQTALYVRRKYGVENALPHIYALVDHKDIEKQLTPIQFFEIQTFGSYEDTYKNLRVGASYRNCLSLAVNATPSDISALSAEGAAKTMNKLYTKDSLRTDYADFFAISIPYKLYLLGLELVDDNKGDLSVLENALSENAELLRKHESQRYEAFLRSKGWDQMTPEEMKQGKRSDMLMKKHACLSASDGETDWSQEGPSYISDLPTIIRFANALFGRSYSVRRIAPTQK